MGSAVEIDAAEAAGLFEATRRFDEVFDLVETLASGTTAVVKRATVLKPPTEEELDGEVDSTPNEVAVKYVSSSDEEVHTFLLEEYRMLQSLRHPSVVNVMSLYVNGRHSLMVMELCQGSLQERGALAEAQAIALNLQMFQAISYLHSKRIVHRDVKPANILLRDDSQTLRLADFNSAIQIGKPAGSSQMLSARGTYHYMAPELLAGLQWNERVDVWACGLSFFFMLYAILPFDCSVVEVKAALHAGEHPDIEWHDASLEVRNFIEQCLAIDMRDRPPALELLQHRLFAPCKHHAFDSWQVESVSPVGKSAGDYISRPRSAPGGRWSADSARDRQDVLSAGAQEFRQLQHNKFMRTVLSREAPYSSLLAVS